MIKLTQLSNENLTKVDIYKLTASPELDVIKNVEDGEILDVKAWCTFNDVKEDTGEVVELLSIMDASGECYSCQSATFKRSFFDILEIMADEPFSIKKISGTTKSGRPYVNCVLNA